MKNIEKNLGARKFKGLLRRSNPPQKGSLLRRGFWSAAIALLLPLKQVYCGSFMSRRCRTPQKTLPIAAVTKNAAIDLMYNGGPKTRRNRRHIAAVFAPAAIGPPQLLVFLVVTLMYSEIDFDFRKWVFQVFNFNFTN